MIAIKLRFVPLMVSKETIGKFMEQSFGLGNANKFIRAIKFRSVLRKAITAINEFNSIKLEELTDNGCIVIPDLETVTYKARSEADVYISIEPSTMQEVVDMVANFVAILTYQQVYDKPYTDDKQFLELKERILDTNYKYVFGAFNQLKNIVSSSRREWSERFENEQVENDPDFSLVNGERLNKFNILTIISKLCSIYNIDFYQALDLPYNVVQTTLWMNLTRENIQHTMTVLKEARLKSKNKT